MFDILKELGRLNHEFVVSVQARHQYQKIFFTRHATCSNYQKCWDWLPMQLLKNSLCWLCRIRVRLVKGYCQMISENCRIAISPMIRAKQTASKLIPDGFAGTIEIADFLTENSNSPSGKPLLSKNDLQNKRDNSLFAISDMYHDDLYFEGLKQKMDEAHQTIAAKTRYSVAESVNNVDLNDDEKITCINSYIARYADHIWFIGHGKNTKKYFENRYLIGKSLEYCETRKVLHYIAHDDTPTEFVVPYYLTVNQITGLFQGNMLVPEVTPVMYTNPVNELQQYILDRKNSHQVSVSGGRTRVYSVLKSCSFLFETKIKY